MTGPDDERGDADEYTCDSCAATFGRAAATRTETMGGLDPSTWQTLCCPACGARVRTVYVGGE